METNKLSEKEREYIVCCYDNIFNAIQKDEERFDKTLRITSMCFIIVSSLFLVFAREINHGRLASVAPVFLSLSIMLNTISYLVGKRWMKNLSEKLSDALKKDIEPEKDTDEEIRSINKKIDVINRFSVILFCIGVISAITLFIIQ